MKNAQIELDPLYIKAKQIVLSSQNTSISHLQRSLLIGYNRASEIMNQLEIMEVIQETNKQGVENTINGSSL